MVNVGGIDRALRFIMGATLIVAPFIPSVAGMLADWGMWKFGLSLVGLVMLGTAVFRFCPAYTLFGIRTCEIGRN